MSYTLATTNAEALERISEVYFHPGDTILDATFGKGGFWKWDYAAFNLVTADIQPVGTLQADFRALPFRDQTFAVGIFDPPYYGHGAQIKSQYGRSNQSVEFLRKNEPTRNLYMKGLLELSRVIRNQGIIVVKCTDGCDYLRMADWIVGLRIGKYCDTVIRTNANLRNWHSNKGTKRKLRSCHSYFLVLKNAYFGRV